jgi:hypothetical protein
MSVSGSITSAEHDATLNALLELVRTPLTAIWAAAEILRDHADLSLTERKEFAEAMLVESERLDAIIALLFAGAWNNSTLEGPACRQAEEQSSSLMPGGKTHSLKQSNPRDELHRSR